MAQIFSKLLSKSSLRTQPQTTAKKIKFNEPTSNNKKLTAEQQLEIANQQKASGKSDRLQLSDPDAIPSLDLVLFQLNRLRLNNDCINFILKEVLIETLQKMYKKHCDEELKKKYADLFTLADEFSERREDNRDAEEAESGESDEEKSDDSGSDSSESDATKQKKRKTSPKQKAGKKTVLAKTKNGNKRALKTNNKANKKQKLRESSESEREDDNDDERRGKDENSSDSESSVEQKTYKQTRKKYST